MAKKAKRGGVRAGAGRNPVHPEGTTMLIGATVPVSLVERLDAMAAKKGWNRSQAVTEAIRGLLSHK